MSPMTRRSSGSTTAPVGLQGLLMSTAFVRGPVAFEIMRAVTLKPSFSCARTRIGPPAREVHRLRERGPVRRRDHHLVAAVEQGLADEVQRLLAPDGDRDLFRRELDLEVLAVAHGHGRAELGQAGRAGVARAPARRWRPVAACATCFGRGLVGLAHARSRARSRRRCAAPPRAGPWPPSARPRGRAPGARGRARSRPDPPAFTSASGGARPRAAGPGTSRAGGARPRAAPARARRRRAGRPP